MTLTLETLDRLIGFETVSAQSNLAIIDYIEAFLKARGARTNRIAGRSREKSGLYAEIGPGVTGGTLLSAHTDVVPTLGQDWSRAPFALSREGDRLFGRGTTDMKGYVACMLHAADLAARTALREPLKLVFSYDEEIGCVGIQEMLPDLAPMLGQPRACFVGEPTQMQIATGHKGKAAFRTVCHGQSGHSALAPKFVNALHLAAELVSGLREVQDRLRTQGSSDAGYDIPFSTVHVGLLQGGTALNIVPDQAELMFEIRHLAADNPAQILDQITQRVRAIQARYQQGDAPARIKVDQINAYPGLSAPDLSPATQLAQRLLPTARTTKVAFGTEAGFFDDLGIPTIVCGPGCMEGQGHKPDEFIEMDQLLACEKMMAGVVDALAQ